MPNQPFISTANRYRKAGWLGAIPLPPGKKHPPPVGFTGGRAAYPTEENIKHWCDPNHEEYVGNAQIGIHLGSVEILPGNLPAVYRGQIVDGWELIGIDIDTYKDKNGNKQLQKLIAQYGELPPTLKSSARWKSGNTSYIAVYLVPKGYRFVGKAASCIEVIQKRHRYMVVWPSLNPDAEMAQYEWRDADDGIVYTPSTALCVVLPESWFGYLSNDGMPESEDLISDLTSDDLLNWAATTWRDSDGDMCTHMAKTLNRNIADTENAAESHPRLTAGHWQILRMGAEGHKGWLTALRKFNVAWSESAGAKRDTDEGTAEEVRRSVVGALGKIEPEWSTLNDDPCDTSDAVAAGEYDSKLADFAVNELCPCGVDGCVGCDTGARLASSDFGGLGPVVGRLQVIKDNPADSYGQHDEGNATHFIDIYGDNVKFISTRKSWTLWLPDDGSPGSGRWFADFEDKYVSLAYQRVRIRQEKFAYQCLQESAKNPSNSSMRKKATSWMSWAKRSGDVSPIKNALESAKRLYVDDNTPVTLEGAEFDSNPKLLGCANGILELSSEPELRSPRREDYVTYNTQVPYIPWRTLANSDDMNLDGYHLWQEYLNMFLPDENVRHFTQKVMGHLLIGENPEKLLIFLYGTHDTGKSTMIGAIAGALGDYYGTIDMNLFKQKDLNPQLIRAVPLRVTGMSEVDAGVMDAATIKRLTGNDKVIAEAKYSNKIFEGRPQFTTIIACNNPPDIANADEALRERILALPFNTTVDRADRKYERQTQIERYSGIAVLSWLVEGWRLYCEEGIKRSSWPEAVAILHHEVVSAFNPTQSFMDQMLVKSRDCEEGILAENMAISRAIGRKRNVPSPADWPEKWTPNAAVLYELYTRWCSANGCQPLSMPAFTRELNAGRPQVRKINGKSVRCYMGIMLKDE